MTDLPRIVSHLQSGRRFLLSSHQRPDGDAIGSAVGLALALQALGKSAEVVMDATPPHYLQPFPAVDRIRIARQVDDAADAAIVLECGSLDRTGVAGLDRSPVINIDHHVGNKRYGTINWIDESAAACTELVFTLIQALGAPFTRDVATHIYLGLLTDTGGFHYSHITPRSFDIARQCVEAGVDPQWVARTHYDSGTVGRVRIFGHVLNGMRLDDRNRVAIITATKAALAATGATYDDTEGIINFPLSVKSIGAVAFFKETDDGQWRVSMRSKGAVDVGAIAGAHGGGGHPNAAGCTVRGELAALQDRFCALLVEEVERKMDS